jgi:hypothetical protein
MSTQVVLEAHKKATQTIIPSRSLVQQHHPPFAEHTENASPSPSLAEPGLGHDLSQVSIHAATTPTGSGAAQPVAQSCPLPAGPRACPFGGACHTCPTQVQAKLAIGQPGDEYEQEADHTAEQAIPAPESQPWGRGADSGKTRFFPMPSIVHEALRSPGQPLDLTTRAFMEQRFGHDFGQVRVHTDARSAQSARSVGALAYTVGRDIVFGPGQFEPGTTFGKQLLAHELTHTLQQGRGSAKPNHSEAKDRGAVPVTRVGGLMLSRQDPPYPGTIGYCRSIGVPCPAPHFHHGTVCRLVHCVRAATANLPFAISPGVCVYQCLDGQICTCVLLGSSTSAICVLTLCDRQAQAGAEPDYDALTERAVAAAEEQMGGQGKEPGEGPAGAPPEAQAKLEIGRPGDIYEQEADRVAERVMRMPENNILRRKCASCSKDDDEEMLQAKELAGKPPPIAKSDMPSIVRRGLSSPGHPLDPATRAFMEPRLGHDFGHVRVHTDAKAAESARAIGASAFTVGSDVVFAAGEYAPQARAGQEIIAHELTHVVQQASRSPSIMRQCDPAWAGLSWGDRVRNARGMGAGAAQNQCFADMIKEALFPNITVHQSTNNATSTTLAITSGLYTEIGTLSDFHVNYDGNLNTKTGIGSLYGDTKYRNNAATNSLQIYMILGPLALNPIGPDWTRMAFEHEQEHVDDYLMESITGSLHSATPGEELRIYQQNFEWHFLDFCAINNTACSYSIANDFMALFTYYANAIPAAQNDAFDSMRMFYQVRIQGIPCNELKFKLWLQSMQNARPAGDAYVARINGLPGLGLVKGAAPITHLHCPSPCP